MLVILKQWSLIIGMVVAGILLGVRPSPGEELPPRPCQTNADCQTKEFCQKKLGDCEGSGECRERPQLYGPMLFIVCGCDGHTYNNPALASIGGINIAHEGACEP